MLGEMIYDVVNASIRSLLNPELTASWEKGLTYVAEGQITEEEYMVKLEHFVQIRTDNVKNLNNQYALRQCYHRMLHSIIKDDINVSKQLKSFVSMFWKHNE